MRKLAFLLVLIAAAVPVAGVFAQGTPTANAKVDALFAKWDKTDSPGLALAVVKDGKVVHQRGYGMANLEHGLAITASTVFLIASLSKHFAVFCILLLVQGGRLNLDDDVRKHVPEVPDFGKKIAVRHLIHHTSGLREYLPLATYAGWRAGDVITERDLLDLVAKQKELNFDPGSQYLYCNTGYELLGIIVKRVSGKSLRDYSQENLFEPLGMKHTQFRDNHLMVIPNFAASYNPRLFGGWQYGLVHHGMAGASNLHTTVEDLARWDRNFYDTRVGGQTVVDRMHEKFTLTDGKEINYAGGLNVTKYRGLKTVDHTGSHGGFRTILLRFPEQKLSVILLANAADVQTTVLARKVADIYLEKEFPPEEKKDKAPAVEVDPKVLDRYVGQYLFDVGVLLTVQKKGGQLFTVTPLGPTTLRPTSETEFEDKDSDVRIVFTPGPELKAILRVPGQSMTGKRLQPPKLSDKQSQEFAGSFYSHELEAMYQVTQRDGRLWLRHRKGEFSLQPAFADEFVGNFGEYGGLVTIHFVRAADQRVTGFTLGSGRVKHLKFARAEISTVQ